MNPLETGLPGDPDMERLVLGGILAHPESYNEVASLLKAEDFLLESHRRIYKAITAILERREPIDRVVIYNELKRSHEEESVGGISYLVSLDEGMPRLYNITSYAKIVKEKAISREAILQAQNLMNQMLSQDYDNRSILSSYLDTFAQLMPVQKGAMQTPKEFLESYPGGLNAFLQPHLKPDGILTGYTSIDDMTGGLHSGDLIVVCGRTSHGKAQPLYSKVLTCTGWKSMGDMRVGEPLASPDGRPSFVTGVFPQGVKESYRVTFSDGRSTICCAQHLWSIRDRDNYDYRTVSCARLEIMLMAKRYRRRVWVPLFDGNFGIEKKLPIDPWLLGVLLGDGALSGRMLRISSADGPLIERVASVLMRDYHCCLSYSSQYDYRIKSLYRKGHKYNRLKAAVQDLGLLGTHSNTKFIPECYMNSTKENRMELLRGLLDTDGYVQKRGPVEYVTVSPLLATQVQLLARSLGAVCSVSRKATTYTYKGEKKTGQLAYRLMIRGANKNSMVWLPRKKRAEWSNKNPRLSIKSIELVGSDVMQCISVSHPLGLYVTDDFIVTHNTAISMNICEKACLKDKARCVVFSLEMSKESLLHRAACSLARVDGMRFRMGYLTTAERIKIAEAAYKLSTLELHIDDSTGLTALDIRSKLATFGAQHGAIHLVVIDYLQLMSVGKRGENRNQEISAIIRQLKLLAKDLGIPFVVLSQLSRAPEYRKGNNRPQLSDLRDSGDIEQCADLVLGVFREELYDATKEHLRGRAEVLILKQRNGPIGICKLAFLKNFSRFENLEEHYTEDQPGFDFKNKAAGE